MSLTLDAMEAFTVADRPRNNNFTGPPAPVTITRHICVPEDHMRFLPRRRRAPQYLPDNVPTPQVGDAYYLAPNNAWAVVLLIHQWEAPDRLKIEIWIEHVTSSRYMRPTGFAFTQ